MKVCDFFFYMLIGGIFLGYCFHEQAKRCGHAIDLPTDTEFAAVALTWPAAIGVGLVIDGKDYVSNVCGAKSVGVRDDARN